MFYRKKNQTKFNYLNTLEWLNLLEFDAILQRDIFIREFLIK